MTLIPGRLNVAAQETIAECLDATGVSSTGEITVCDGLAFALDAAWIAIGMATGDTPPENVAAWFESVMLPSGDDTTETDMNEATLLNTEWRWQEFQSMDDTTVTVPNPEKFLLTLDGDGGVSLRVDCNTAGGSYTLDGSSLTIEISVMTRVACPPSLDRDYLRYLADVRSYVIEDGELFLSLMADGGIMRFSAE